MSRPGTNGRGPGSIALIVLILFLTTACAPDRPSRVGGGGALRDVPCGAVARSVLDTWGAGADHLTAAPDPSGGVVLRFAAERIGSWVVVRVPEREVADAEVSHGADAVVRVERWSDGIVEAGQLDGACAWRELRVAPGGPDVVDAPSATGAPRADAHPPAGGGGQDGGSSASLFMDADLRRVVDGLDGDRDRDPDTAVVVYLWSPHMPLSVDGWPEVSAAGVEMKLRVVPVLFPGSDVSFARREAERVGIPPDGLREARSTDLLMRDALVHAPAIVVYGRARVSPVLPGYRNADGYRRYLRAFLSGEGG